MSTSSSSYLLYNFFICRISLLICRKKKENVESGLLNLQAKRTAKEAKYPEIDAAVLKWFSEMRSPIHRCKPLPVSRAHIQARALHEAKLRNILNFKASDGWFRNWRKRLSINKSVRLSGEAGDVNPEDILVPMRDLRQLLINYKPENIFNMDESGLFFRALPSRTYLLNEIENNRTARGTKALKAKDRLTILLCVNATGTCKIPPLIVGCSKTPHCFRDSPSPLPYTHQANSWVNTAVYRHWWDTVFIPAVRSFTKEPVALLMDNFSGHDKTYTDPTGQVSIHFFPPNSTSIHQPLDQGIISILKTQYKKILLSRTMEAYDNIENFNVRLVYKSKEEND